MAASSHLVEEFENSFQNCLSCVTNEHFNINDKEEVKTSVELTVQKFLDSAKQLEAFFLQKRLQLCLNKPEQIIKEDVNELRQEIQRKEMLIQKHHEKLTHWQMVLSQQAHRGPLGPGQASTPSQPPPNPAAAPPPPPQAAPQATFNPQQHQPMQQPPAPSAPQQASTVPMHHPQMPNTQSVQHPGAMTGAMGANYPQGPLAYLEQTTSNIGMTERR